MPKISVITVNYNNREGLRATLQSTLAQTYSNYEYIVIDGGSTDGSKTLLEDQAARVDHWVSEPDGGIYPAMNKGIAIASGEYLLFMNSGDTFYGADVLEQVAPALERHRDFYTGGVCLDGKIRKAPTSVGPLFFFNQSLPHQSTFIRAELLKARPYREDVPIVADWEQQLYELLVRDGTYECLETVICNYDTTGISSVCLAEGKLDDHVLPMLRDHFSERMIAAHRFNVHDVRFKLRTLLEHVDSVRERIRLLRYSLKLFFTAIHK